MVSVCFLFSLISIADLHFNHWNRFSYYKHDCFSQVSLNYLMATAALINTIISFVIKLSKRIYNTKQVEIQKKFILSRFKYVLLFSHSAYFRWFTTNFQVYIYISKCCILLPSLSIAPLSRTIIWQYFMRFP